MRAVCSFGNPIRWSYIPKEGLLICQKSFSSGPSTCLDEAQLPLPTETCSTSVPLAIFQPPL